MESVVKEKVIAYIDGYNLYFGLKESGFNRYLWLNIQGLVQSLLKPNQHLVGVKYFTTLVTDDVDKRQRQKQFITALQTLPLVTIFYGKFQKQQNSCNACGNKYRTNSEKMTDVNIATQLVHDYYQDNFDMAMVISGDTDLIPPIKLINENSKTKRVFVAFPPNRINEDVRKHAKGDLVIGRKKLLDAQFSDIVVNANGQNILKPSQWV